MQRDSRSLTLFNLFKDFIFAFETGELMLLRPLRSNPLRLPDYQVLA
jgi:hypothetical protein